VIDDDVLAEQRRVATDAAGIAQSEILVVKDLHKTYTGRHRFTRAVRGLSFGVPPGECFGLLGVNGAGKSSTFKMITGDVAVTAGEAWVAGHSILKDMAKVCERML
jgi:ABC-type multidrug transport system ATPase subunit